MKRYRHIVFDIDGTLLDTEHPVLISLQEALEQAAGLHYELKDLTFAFGIPGNDALAQLGIPDAPAVRRVWIELLKQRHGEMKLFEGADEVTRRLSERGVGLGIVTSKTHETFELDFTGFGIADRFGCVICSDDTAEHKPAPGPLLAYLERTGAQADEALYVGDSIYDEQCAHAAGLDFALAVWGHHARDLPAEHYPDTLLDLLDLV